MNNKAFTFIELLITLTVFAIAFLPLMNMFTVSLEQSSVTGDLTTARYLAQEGMEKVKNLNFTKAQLLEAGDTWEPPLKEQATVINGEKWRTLSQFVEGRNPLEIRVKVFKEIDLNKNRTHAKPVVELVTLYEDYEWSNVP